MTKRVGLYVRVSTEEQKVRGLSVDSQIEALQSYARENNYTVVGVYNDAGISARKSYKKRPALLEMIKDCQNHKIDLVLITKLDRFFRSVPDYYAVMEQMGNTPWKAIQEDYETQTSSGVFKVNIMLSVAQSEADRTSERIKAIFDYKRAKGEPLTGKPAVGYIYKEGKWYKNKDTQKGVEAFFETYLATFNKKLAISKALELGVRISDETARTMLYGNNYCGVVPYITESYITKEQHDLILANKPQCTRNNKYSYIFTGVVRCGKCGRPLSATTTVNVRKSGKRAVYPMYVCDYGRRNYGCTGSFISEKRLEGMLLENLEKELNDYNIRVSLGQDSDNSDKIRTNKEKLNRLKVLFELGDMDVDEYKAKRGALIDEINTLEALVEKKPIHLDATWKDIYSQLDIAHKNSFWRQTIDYVSIPCKKPSEVFINF